MKHPIATLFLRYITHISFFVFYHHISINYTMFPYTTCYGTIFCTAGFSFFHSHRYLQDFSTWILSFLAHYQHIFINYIMFPYTTCYYIIFCTADFTLPHFQQLFQLFPALLPSCFLLPNCICTISRFLLFIGGFLWCTILFDGDYSQKRHGFYSKT